MRIEREINDIHKTDYFIFKKISVFFYYLTYKNYIKTWLLIITSFY